MHAHQTTLSRILGAGLKDDLTSRPALGAECAGKLPSPGNLAGLIELGRQPMSYVQPAPLPSLGGSLGLGMRDVKGWGDGAVIRGLGVTRDDVQGMHSGLIPVEVYSTVEQKPLSEILSAAGKKALGGGLPGMAAMGIQVGSLMWLRTTVNYQYKNGTSTREALRTLYKEGGVRRFYRGVGPALIQGPMSRFGDTAANAGTLALFDSYASTKDLPVAVKTFGASTAAACWRIFLMPVDACKTILQVEGKDGLKVLRQKLGKSGPTVLYHGALAASSATLVGHYPWFFTYNYLNEVLPQYEELPRRLLRSAFIGFCSSFVSDTCSNSIRVIKTTRQTSNVATSYPEVIKAIYKKDGFVNGFLIRGLGTKIVTNGLQGILFSVLWRLGMDWYNKNEKEKIK